MFGYFIVLILSPTQLWLTTLVFASMTKTVLLLDPNHGSSFTKTSLPSTPVWLIPHPFLNSHLLNILFHNILMIFFLPHSTPIHSLLCRFVFNCNTVWSWVPSGLDLKTFLLNRWPLSGWSYPYPWFQNPLTNRKLTKICHQFWSLLRDHDGKRLFGISIWMS